MTKTLIAVEISAGLAAPLGASADGKLKATRHLTVNDSATITGFVEPCGLTTQKLYATETLETSHRYVPSLFSAMTSPERTTRQ